MKLFKLSFAALMLTVAAIITSCSSSTDKLSEEVPAETKGILRISPDKWLESAGFHVGKDGAIELSDEVKEAIPANYRPIVPALLAYTEGIDLKEMLVFDYDSYFVGAALLKDSDKVVKNLTDLLGEPEKDGAYKVFYTDGAVAVDGNMIFVADRLQQIKDAREAASKKNISSLPAIKEWVDADKAMSFAVPVKDMGLPSQYASQWLCGALEFDGAEALGEIVLMDKDGKREPFGESFGVIDTDFLRYVPAGQGTFAAAIGNIENPELRNLLDSYATQMGQMKEFVSGLNGTTSFAAVLPDISKVTEIVQLIESNNMTWLRYIDFLLMAHYPQQSVSDAMSLISAQGAASDGSESLVVNIFPGCPVYISAVDGYLAISDYPLEGKAHNELNNAFEGRRASIALTIAPQADAESLGIGVDASLWLETDALKGRMAFTNTDKRFLAVIVEAMLQPGVTEMLQQIMAEDVYGHDYASYDYYPEDEAEW